MLASGQGGRGVCGDGGGGARYSGFVQHVWMLVAIVSVFEGSPRF